MFGRQNLYCTVENFNGVRVKDERENDRNLLVEFRFETPLGADLADEIQPKIVGDLFDQTKDGFTPKGEMSQVVLTLRPGRQVVTLKQHPELDHFARVVGVAIKHIVVKKAAKLEQWVLSFVMTFPLDDALMIGLIRMIRNGVFMTCELMDPNLFKDGGDVIDVTPTGTDEGGVGKTARRRGRPRKNAQVEGATGVQPALPPASDVEPPADTQAPA